MKIQLAFDEIDENPQVKEFHDFLIRLDERVKEVAHLSASQWFPKLESDKISAYINVNFTSSVRMPKKQEFSPLVGLKVSAFQQDNYERIMLDVFENGEKVPLEAVVPNSRVQCLFSPRSLYFVGGQFGVTLGVLQVEIISSDQLRGYAFIRSATDINENKDSKLSEEIEEEWSSDSHFQPSSQSVLPNAANNLNSKTNTNLKNTNTTATTAAPLKAKPFIPAVPAAAAANKAPSPPISTSDTLSSTPLTSTSSKRMQTSPVSPTPKVHVQRPKPSPEGKASSGTSSKKSK